MMLYPFIDHVQWSDFLVFHEIRFIPTILVVHCFEGQGASGSWCSEMSCLLRWGNSASRESCLLSPVSLVVNWPRKWAVLGFGKKSKISQNVLQKSITFKTDLNFFGRVKNISGPSRSFSTPNFLSGASRKGLNFLITFDPK